jgi:A/G-specific adenine glycosylase
MEAELSPPAMPPSPLLADPPAFRERLLAWYRVHRRRLPWREAPSAYGTVVSEFMLQQTQVKTVLPYFERWMRELPDFAALAAAPETRVLHLWEGLGYYARARNLHRLAQAVVALPEPPRTREGWAALPGIGPYTSAAIASIAFEQPAACVDGNVVRILARLSGDDTRHRDSASASKAYQALADRLVDPLAPGDHNQAMMELGATLCTKRSPQCLVCPVAEGCAARLGGDPAALPRLVPKQIEKRVVARAWVLVRGRLLLETADKGGRRLAGLLELPRLERVGGVPSDASLLVRHRRAITRFAIEEPIYRAEPPSGKLPEGLVWIELEALSEVTLSGPHRRWIQALLGSSDSTRSRDAAT